MSASARRIFADFRVFGRGYLRNGVGLFFSLIFPVILILLFGAIFAGGGAATVYVQNNDGGQLSRQYIAVLNGTGVNGSWPIILHSVDPSVNFTQFLKEKSGNSAADGISIPQNFSLDYQSNVPINVTVYGSPSQSSSQIVSQIVTGVSNSFNLKGTAPIIGVSSQTISAQQTKYIDSLVPGLIGFSILISPMFAMVNISAEYKKTKLFKQLSLTPLSKMEWLASKILWYITLSFVSLLILVAVGIFVFGAHITLTLWLLPFIVLGPTMFCALGMLVGTLSKSVETASVIGNVITFPMMFLSGTFFPLYLMPEYLRNFAHVLPLFYVVEGLNNVMVYGNYGQALIDIGVTAVLAFVVFVAAAKLFKWRED